MHVKDSSRAQAVTLQVIPTADHGGWHAEIVCHRLNCISPAYGITGSAAGVSGCILGRSVLTRSDGDDELAFGLEVFLAIQIIHPDDRAGRGAIRACHRGQSVTRTDLVIAPP